ncbi:MAG: ATP-grasp domain-containing protein [Bacteroidaceae bacterium]|nr:ATP-grasp domain-containing protein [Bacteroidaceae bacterium]
MERKCDVILTYCWNRVGYTIQRSLAEKGLKVWAADTSKWNICSMSKYCSGSFTYPNPFANEEAFISALKEKIEELKPQVLLPTHDESVVIMRHRHELPSELIIPYENEQLLLNLANKAWATRKAGELGIPVPQVYKTVDEVKQFPVVFKTVIGNSAKGVYFPNSKEELLALQEQYKDEETLIEEWVGGSDYSVDCVRWDGFWKSSVYHALVTKTNGGGTTTQREIVRVPELENYAKTLLDAVDYHGVCGLDFRYDPVSGKMAFIEVNARFTGGLATPVAAGFNIPWAVYKLATEGKYDEPCDVREGTKTKWILGDIITIVGRLLSRKLDKEELKQVLTFKGFDAFDDFRKDDKWAILGEMSYYLGKLVKNGKLNP